MKFEKRILEDDWYKDPVFWRIYAPFMFDSNIWQRTDFEASSIVRLLDLKPGTRILDTCCGVGRHSVTLSKLGFLVTGIDENAEFLQAARDYAEAEKTEPVFLESDVLSFSTDLSFDAVLNLGTSFGFFPTKDDDLSFLSNMHSRLSKSGCMIIETAGKETVALHFKESEWFERENAYVLAKYEISDAWSKLVNRWIAVTEMGTKDYTFRLRLYSAVELEEMMRKVGFRDIEVFGDYDGRPYDHRAETLVMTARK